MAAWPGLTRGWLSNYLSIQYYGEAVTLGGAYASTYECTARGALDKRANPTPRGGMFQAQCTAHV